VNEQARHLQGYAARLIPENRFAPPAAARPSGALVCASMSPSDNPSEKLVLDFIEGIKTAFDREPNVRGIENERIRLAEALFAVHDFIARFPSLGPKFAKSFGDLGTKIGDINSGAVHPLFVAPKDVQHRDPSELWCARANLVFAVNALVKCGKSVPAAAAEVIGWHSTIWVQSEEVKRTLLNWRKAFSAGRIKNEMANELFNVGREFIDAYADQPSFLYDRAKDRADAAAKVIGVFN